MSGAARYVHPTAQWAASARIGPGAEVLQFVVLREDSRVGAGARVCSHVYVDVGVRIGARSIVKNHAFLCEGVVLEEDVFLGPGVTFTNVRRPRAHTKAPRPFPTTTVKRGATVGARAVVLPGITIGRDAMVGAGAVVVEDVPDGGVVVGNPARRLVAYNPDLSRRV